MKINQHSVLRYEEVTQAEFETCVRFAYTVFRAPRIWVKPMKKVNDATPNALDTQGKAVTLSPECEYRVRFPKQESIDYHYPPLYVHATIIPIAPSCGHWKSVIIRPGVEEGDTK